MDKSKERRALERSRGNWEGSIIIDLEYGQFH